MNDSQPQPVAAVISDTPVALIGKDIQYIQRDIAKINENIDKLSGVYATQVSVSDSNRTTDSRLKKLEEASGLWKFLSPALSAILSAVLTFFVVQYFTMLK